jgi:hypothetical protein
MKYLSDSYRWPDEAETWGPAMRKGHGISSKLTRVLNMDEQYEQMKLAGATFYESVESCPDLPKSIDDAVQRFRKYEERLKRFDDRQYAIDWDDDPKRMIELKPGYGL